MHYVITHAYHIACPYGLTHAGIDLREMGIGDFITSMSHHDVLAVSSVKAHVLYHAVGYS